MAAGRFTRLFQPYFSTTPYQMLLEVRMLQARRLLEQGGCQVAQVGWRGGYRHPSTFNAAFACFFGHPPKVARPSTDAPSRPAQDKKELFLLNY